jgi:hypothetical protein
LAAPSGQARSGVRFPQDSGKRTPVAWLCCGHDDFGVSRQRLLALVVFGLLVLTAGGAIAAVTPRDPGIPLDSLPPGGSAHEVAGRQVVLVRDGDVVTGFLRLTSWSHGMVSWCRDDDVFLVPSYGETFDSKGRAMRGIALRGLDAVEVAVRGGRVFVAPGRVTKGRPRVVDHHVVLDWTAIGAWRAAHPGRDLPSDFCP